MKIKGLAFAVAVIAAGLLTSGCKKEEVITETETLTEIAEVIEEGEESGIVIETEADEEAAYETEADEEIVVAEEGDEA